MDTVIISKEGIVVRISIDTVPWKYKLRETGRVYRTQKGAIRAGRAFIRLQRKKLGKSQENKRQRKYKRK